MENISKIHFVGLGGVGMGTFAVALAKSGYQVSGSDLKLYDPMKTVLKEASIELIEGFTASNLQKVSPDVVIIGNVVRKENEEAMAWIGSGKKFLSFPEAVRQFLIGEKKSIVCAGTHGKTTTTSWIAFLLKEAGVDPSYLIGGVPMDLPSGCHASKGDYLVCEGDEYDSAFFDKGPKFLHYHPHFVVLSSVEFDHADIYRDLAHVKASFEKLISLLPGDGLLIARFDDPNIQEIMGLSYCPVQTFGMGLGAMWRIGKITESEKGFEFEVIYKGRSAGLFETPMFGEHNLMNLLSGIVCAVNLGIPIEKIRPIVPKFHGAKRRQQILKEQPFLLVDDFAHHPTEVNATLSAVRRRYGQRKIWALFEPRSATARRSVHQAEYAKAFQAADEVLVKNPYRATELSEAERLSETALVDALKEAGKPAQSFDSTDNILKYLKSQLKENDIVVVMSNGEFDKIQEKILTMP